MAWFGPSSGDCSCLCGCDCSAATARTDSCIPAGCECIDTAYDATFGCTRDIDVSVSYSFTDLGLTNCAGAGTTCDTPITGTFQLSCGDTYSDVSYTTYCTRGDGDCIRQEVALTITYQFTDLGDGNCRHRIEVNIGNTLLTDVGCDDSPPWPGIVVATSSHTEILQWDHPKLSDYVYVNSGSCQPACNTTTTRCRCIPSSQSLSSVLSLTSNGTQGCTISSLSISATAV